MADAIGGEAAFKPLLDLRGSRGFNEISGREEIGRAFGNAEVLFNHSALVFDSAAPVIRYLDSCRTLCTADDARWHQLLVHVGDEVTRRLANGPLRSSKRIAILRARRVCLLGDGSTGEK